MGSMPWRIGTNPHLSCARNPACRVYEALPLGIFRSTVKSGEFFAKCEHNVKKQSNLQLKGRPHPPLPSWSNALNCAHFGFHGFASTGGANVCDARR